MTHLMQLREVARLFLVGMNYRLEEMSSDLLAKLEKANQQETLKLQEFLKQLKDTKEACGAKEVL